MADREHDPDACELGLYLRYREATGISDSPGLCVRVEDILASRPPCL